MGRVFSRLLVRSSRAKLHFLGILVCVLIFLNQMTLFHHAMSPSMTTQNRDLERRHLSGQRRADDSFVNEYDVTRNVSEEREIGIVHNDGKALTAQVIQENDLIKSQNIANLSRRLELGKSASDVSRNVGQNVLELKHLEKDKFRKSAKWRLKMHSRKENDRGMGLFPRNSIIVSGKNRKVNYLKPKEFQLFNISQDVEFKRDMAKAVLPFANGTISSDRERYFTSYPDVKVTRFLRDLERVDYSRTIDCDADTYAAMFVQMTLQNYIDIRRIESIR